MATGKTNDKDDVTRQENESTKSKSEEARDTENGGDDGEGDDDDNDSKGGGLWEGIPDNHPIRKEVSNLRSEAASKRNENTSLRETVDELTTKTSEMKSADEFQAAVEQANQKVQEALLDAARERHGRGLPDSLIPRLEGKTEEEIQADADALRESLGLDKEAEQEPQPRKAPKPPAKGGRIPDEKTSDVESHIERLNRSRGIGQ